MNTSKFPVGAVVTIAGAAVLALAVFLPFSEPAGLIRVVYSNTMMQHGGWELLALAAIIAFAAFWAASRPAQWWRPLIGAVLALAEMGFIFSNQENRTLYPMGLDGKYDMGHPIVTDFGIGPYVAALGTAIALLGCYLLWDSRNRAVPEQGPAHTAAKQCPDCAETVLADARVCKHCQHQFPTTNANCFRCGHIQSVLTNLVSFSCEQCGQTLQRKHPAPPVPPPPAG